MKSRLFLREYVRATVAGGTVMAGLMLASHLGQIFVKAPSRVDYQSAVGAAAVILFASCGFIAAERAFSLDFKERRLTFLQVLPASRSTVWALLLGARLLAALTVVGIGIACRPSVLEELREPGVAAAVAMAFALLFGIGAVVALLGRSVVGIYLAGAVAFVAIAVPLVAAAAFLGISGPELQWQGGIRGLFESRGISELPGGAQARLLGGVALARLACATAVVAAALLLLSWRFFRHSELLLLRARVRRSAGASVAVLLLVALLARALAWPALARAMPQRWERAESQISPTGKALLIQARAAAENQLDRLTVVSTADGSTLARFDLTGVLFAGFAPGGEAVDTVERRGDRPSLLSFAGRTHFVRRTFDGRELLDRELESVGDAVWSDRQVLFLCSQTDSGPFSFIDPLRKEPLAQVGDGGQPILRRTPHGLAALAMDREGAVSGWHFRDGRARALSGRLDPRLAERRPMLVGGRVLDEQAGTAALGERLGRPVDGALTAYLVGGDWLWRWQSSLWDVDAEPAVYAAAVDCSGGAVSLHAWLPATRRWTLLSDGLEVRRREAGFLSFCAEPPASGLRITYPGAVFTTRADIDMATGVFAFVSPAGKVELFDPLLARSIIFGTVPGDGHGPQLIQEREPGSNAVGGVAQLAGEGGCLRVRWRYVPGSGQLERLGVRPCTDSFWPGGVWTSWVPLADGSELWMGDPVAVTRLDGSTSWQLPAETRD